MQVVVYSDYVCPFCFLAMPALDRLAKEEGVQIDWRAFELRPEPVPTLDPGGEYLTRVWRESVYPLAEKLGVSIALPPVQPRSRLAFEGAEFARRNEMLHAYNGAVFKAFFQEGRDIGQLDVLTDIAGDVGLDPGRFREAVESHRYLHDVLMQEREAADVGVNGVPTIVVGEHILPGVVPFEVLRNLVEEQRAVAV